MPQESERAKVVVVGAGPVGALAALYAAQRGNDVEVYELRNDLRDPTTTPLNFTKSINLALSERGINAMRHSGRSDLLDRVINETIPMKGRMVHGRSVSGELTEQSQDYDAHGRTLFAADRGALNKILLDELENLPNVRFFFNHKLTGADFRHNKAWFEVHSSNLPKTGPQGRDQEIEVTFDLLIGADGAHSAARYHMMKYARMDYQQEYIDTLWCEFTISAKDSAPSSDLESKFKLSPHHLHIWPGQSFMFIAIPSLDGSFTCTLFLPSSHFSDLESSPDTLPDFFNKHFPGVTTLIPPSALIASFKQNPHLPLISIKCAPYHFASSAVILGDAAHAMVPFYGQGMNAGLEDVHTLFTILDAHPADKRGEALAEYSELRKPDAHAINDLALQNYTEMRSSVTSPVYKMRKYLEETLSTYIPSLGWQTKYARVSFGNERYSEAMKKSEHQGRMIVIGLVGLLATPAVVGGLAWWLRWGKKTRFGWEAWIDRLKR